MTFARIIGHFRLGVIRVVRFPREGDKIRKVWDSKSIFQKEIIVFWELTKWWVHSKKEQKSDFQVNFLCQKWCQSFYFFFIKNINFLLLTFLYNLNFQNSEFSKMMFNFRWPATTSDHKTKSFLLEYWSLAKISIEFCTPLLETRQPILPLLSCKAKLATL